MFAPQVNPTNIETEINFGTLEGSSLVVLSRILSEVWRRDDSPRDDCRRRSALNQRRPLEAQHTRKGCECDAVSAHRPALPACAPFQVFRPAVEANMFGFAKKMKPGELEELQVTKTTLLRR